MIRRLLHYSTASITGAAVLLALSSLASRLVGVLRDRIFAHTFGASQTLDAYYAAFRIPDLLYNLLVVGALSAGFIPVFLELWSQKREEAWKMTGGLAAILGTILILLGALGALFAAPLTELLTPGFDEETQRLSTQMTRIMMVSPVLLGLSAILGSILQALRSFLVYALTPIFYNIGIIIGVLLFVPLMGPLGLAIGVVLGALLHLAIQIPSLVHHGLPSLWPLRWTPEPIKKIVALMAPRTLGLASSHITLFGITIIASLLGAGSISIFHFASNLQYLPIGIIGIPFAIAVFPALSELAGKESWDEFRHRLTSVIRQILFFIIPATILAILLRAQLVRVILGTGSFDWEATIGTSDTLAFFALSFFAQALIPTLARAFYAVQDTWTPFLVGLISSLVTIVGALLWTPIYGIPGIALAFSFASVIQLALLWIILRTHLKTLHESSLLPFLSRISIAGLCMAITVQLLKEPLALLVDMNQFLGVVTQGIAAGILGLTVYLWICITSRVEEVAILKQGIQKRWLKHEAMEPHLEDLNPPSPTV